MIAHRADGVDGGPCHDTEVDEGLAVRGGVVRGGHPLQQRHEPHRVVGAIRLLANSPESGSRVRTRPGGRGVWTPRRRAPSLRTFVTASAGPHSGRLAVASCQRHVVTTWFYLGVPGGGHRGGASASGARKTFRYGVRVDTCCIPPLRSAPSGALYIARRRASSKRCGVRRVSS